MDVVALLAVFVALAAVVAIVAAPLRAARRDGGDAAERAVADRIAELQARKEAKYREIRDAEMDLRTGKLSEADHSVLDRQLRAEAVDVLRALDEAADR